MPKKMFLYNYIKTTSVWSVEEEEQPHTQPHDDPDPIQWPWSYISN